MTAYEPAQYGLLGVARTESGDPTLFIYSRQVTPWHQKIPTGHTRVPISKDAPLAEQGQITIEVVITCEAQEGEKAKTGKHHTLTAVIAPDPGPPIGYKVVQEDRGGKRLIFGEWYRSLIIRAREAWAERRKAMGRRKSRP